MVRRKILLVGKSSKAIVIPPIIDTGKEATIAGNRLLLIDPRGEVPENYLLRFLEEFVEPNFWQWYCNFKVTTSVQKNT